MCQKKQGLKSCQRLFIIMPMSITPPDVLCAYTSSTRVYAQAAVDLREWFCLKTLYPCFLANPVDSGTKCVVTKSSARKPTASLWLSQWSEIKSVIWLVILHLYQAGVDEQLVMETNPRSRMRRGLINDMYDSCMAATCRNTQYTL
jgi:hypothetical protein